MLYPSASFCLSRRLESAGYLLKSVTIVPFS